MTPYAEKKGIRRLVWAFRYSINGLRAAWSNEEAFREECIIAVVVVPFGLWLGTTGVERAVLLGFYLLIPLVELLNSAIEAAVDRMGPEHHVLSGRAKDLGSAAVLMIIVINIVVWGVVVYDHF